LACPSAGQPTSSNRKGGGDLSTVRFEVVTPERKVLSEDVNMITIKTGGGELGILPHHMATSATVRACIVTLKLPDGEDYIPVSGGFLEILPDKVTLLADVAELPTNIDVDRAERARERAEKRLNQRTDGLDETRAEAALRRAIHRLEAVELSGKAGHPLTKNKQH
jgi:F-type H+-transporting ATPase subunit epsilon